MRVRDTLLAFDGVISVDVIPKAHLATVTYDETKITAEKMMVALQNEQLEVTQKFWVK